jgi:hypothetical protein
MPNNDSVRPGTHIENDATSIRTPSSTPSTPNTSPQKTRVHFLEQQSSSPGSGFSSLTTSECLSSTSQIRRRPRSRSSEELEPEEDAFANHQLHLQVLGLI